MEVYWLNVSFFMFNFPIHQVIIYFFNLSLELEELIKDFALISISYTSKNLLIFPTTETLFPLP